MQGSLVSLSLWHLCSPLLAGLWCSPHTPYGRRAHRDERRALSRFLMHLLRSKHICISATTKFT